MSQADKVQELQARLEAALNVAREPGWGVNVLLTHEDIQHLQQGLDLWREALDAVVKLRQVGAL